ncbi:MAG: pyridoxine 5'-phosphate synthase [Betaproteobacteria bacterium]|nr:pyridoxine 5'-phosphate synthase [Betaproteobacteria bacterium]
MKLGVNIDHVATVRRARQTDYPDVLRAALLAEEGGADFITVHLREDRRHITDSDLPVLQKGVRTFLNLEIAAVAEMQKTALSLRPPKVCLVPERRAELTTEGGLDARGLLPHLREFCAPLLESGLEVSLFIAPDLAQIDAAVQAGVGAVELHTGEYARGGGLRTLRLAAAHAAAAGLEVHAGHGLHVGNAAAAAAIPEISELNIGHAIVARALFVGMKAAVQEIAALVKK